LIGTLDPKTIAGSVIVVPLINVASFEQKVVHLNPTDRKNMNRFYPGNPKGTQSERASYLITQEVVEQSDHLIDLHGGDLDESLRPYSYWTVSGNAAQDSVSKAMVLAFGLDHIISTERPKIRRPPLSRNTATTRGKPSITVEAGHAGTVLPADVDALLNGCLSVMGFLKMISARYAGRQAGLARAARHGDGDSTEIFHPAAQRGQQVSAGTPLGHHRLSGTDAVPSQHRKRGSSSTYTADDPERGTIASIGVSAKAPWLLEQH
jgi:predicted deacylase